MLLPRIISAIILAIAVILGLFCLSKDYFVAFWGIVSLLAMWEWNTLSKITKNNFKFINLFIFLSILIFIGYRQDITVHNNLFIGLLIITNCWYLISFIFTFSYPNNKNLWTNSVIFKLIIGYLSILSFFSSIIFMRYQIINNDIKSAWLLLWVMSLVWSADIGAYVAGKLFGKQKLIPAVSPGKTIQGAIGGMLSTILCGFIGSYYLPELNIYIRNHIFFITWLIIVAIVSMQGDLLESMLKREAKIKDSSNLIPGHGGVLDRIDSMLYVLPFVCLFFIFYQIK